VEVVVLDRLGDPVAGQPCAHRRDPRDGVVKPGQIHRPAPAIGRVERPKLVEQRLQPGGQHRQPHVGRADRQELRRRPGQVHLELPVRRQGVQPARHIPLRRDQLAEADARVLHQHPAPVEVHGERGRDQVGASPGQEPDDLRLVAKGGRAGLEEQRTAVRWHPQDRGPRPIVDRLDRPGAAGAPGRQLRVDPDAGGRVRQRRRRQIVSAGQRRDRGLGYARYVIADARPDGALECVAWPA
jgi:hypothetical protein